MKQSNIYSILLAGIYCIMVMTLTGCDISELPYTSVTDEELRSNPGSVEAVTLGNYSQLKDLKFNKTVHQIGEYGSDNISMSGASTSHTFFNYNYQRITTNSYMTDLWGISYKMIVNCNNVISSTGEGISNEMDHLIGENYFIRGMLYHWLVITFGKAYHIASDTDQAIPLKLSTDRNDFPPRATVKEVYAQVVKDLKKAEELMGKSGIKKSACFANTWAAKALLSRVYLYMHQYKEAEAYATDVIEHSGKELLSANQYMIMNELVPESNPEAIWAIRMIKDDLTKLGEYSVIGSQYTIIVGKGYGEIYASWPLIRTLEKYPSDIRRTFIQPQYEDVDKSGNQLYEVAFISENFFYTNAVEPASDPLHRTYFRYQNVTKTGENEYAVKVDAKSDPFELAESTMVTEADGTTKIKARQIYRAKDGTTGKAEWREYTARVQKKMKKRNDYPRYYIGKCSYQEQFSQLWSPMMIRLSEIYLNRAEARYYQGNTAGAISDMNVTRTRATIPAYSEAQDGDLLDAILDERRKELYAEAQRKFDLLRNNKVIDRHYPGCHDRGAESVVVQEIRVTDNCAVFYLPQREIDAYPIKLEQNP